MPANEENKKMIHPSSPNAKRRRNEALKTVVNSRGQPGRLRSTQQSNNVTNTMTVASRPVTKQRQLLTQPKTFQKGSLTVRSEKLKKEISKELPTLNSKSIPQTSNITRTERKY
ncbi:unnamed protein product [Brugia pahangi]|uniref:TPX2 domain-containing protein n=1 Tax=Brugia pahangi TaxID=6280 RepID=A0A0N4T0E1_BRUPA|nr:unnamed protein product [Brugia pahangi]